MAGTLEEGFKTPWAKIRVALTGTDGCTGWQVKHELFILRRDEGMTIYGRVGVADDKFANIPEGPLSKDEFDEIAKKLDEFYQIAKNEINSDEYYGSLQPADREAYDREHGTRYGGPSGYFIYVEFYTDLPDIFVQDAFAGSKSVGSYGDWMRGVLERRSGNP
jgi:hypothetical protein